MPDGSVTDGERVPAADAIADVNGLRLRYRLSGDGPLAVFGHGLLGSIEQLHAEAALLDELQSDVRLLLYDARGHGKSTGPEDPSGYNWATFGEDMAAWPALMGEDSALFGGASMGAGTALWVALERPEVVRALVLAIPPPLGPDTMRGDGERQAIQVLGMLAGAIETFGLEQTAEIAKQYPGFAPNPEEAEERAAWLTAQNERYLVHAIRGLLAAKIHDPADYAAIKVPMLVLAHEGDDLHPIRAARLLKQMVPHAELRVAPDPSYWRTNPETFIGEVKTFLSSTI